MQQLAIIIPAQSAVRSLIPKDTLMLDSFICGYFNGCVLVSVAVE